MAIDRRDDGVHMRMAEPCWTYLKARLRTGNSNNCSGTGPAELGPHGAATFIENIPGILGQAEPVW